METICLAMMDSIAVALYRCHFLLCLVGRFLPLSLSVALQYRYLWLKNLSYGNHLLFDIQFYWWNNLQKISLNLYMRMQMSD